ncbi:unnamed protein product, partial [Didymodactylos carnosus]
ISVGYFYLKVKEYMKKLNLFKLIPPADDEHEIKNESVSTHLFILLLFISVVILFSYTSLSNVTQTGTIKQPNTEQYLDLYDKYPHILSGTFSGYGSRSFEMLSSLCQLINSAINNELNIFDSNVYVSSTVASKNLVETQINSSINLFIMTTANQFTTSLEIIRDITNGNALVSGEWTNFNFWYDTSLQMTTAFSSAYSIVDGEPCLCSSSVLCKDDCQLFNFITEEILYLIPGFYHGCFVVQTLLQ